MAGLVATGRTELGSPWFSCSGNLRCVVGLGGLELPTKRLLALGWRCRVRGFVSANSRLNFNETVSALSLCRQKFRFLRTETTADRDIVRVRARLLRRKAEHLALSGPFRRQVGEASDAHAKREPAIDGGCSELAADNRLVGGSSPPSPTTQSCSLVHTHVTRVEVQPDRLVIHLAEPPSTLEVPWQKTPARRRREILLPEGIRPEHARPYVPKHVHDWSRRLPVAAIGSVNSSLIQQQVRTASRSGRTAAPERST
jgi:hypothetical protein